MAKNKDAPGRPPAPRTWAQGVIAERIRALGAAGHQHIGARRDADPPQPEHTERNPPGTGWAPGEARIAPAAERLQRRRRGYPDDDTG